MNQQVTIEYLPAAQEDLMEILNYIVKEDLAAALEILNTFDISILELKNNPLLGKIPNKRMEKLGWRELNIRSYSVYYVFKDPIIEIRAIVHGWMTWEKYSARNPLLSGKTSINHAELVELMKEKIRLI